MPRAEIRLEDADDGQGVHIRFEYDTAWDKASGAHQMANHIQGLLNDMVKGGELTAEPVAVEG
jgi:hypothetical protein